MTTNQLLPLGQIVATSGALEKFGWGIILQHISKHQRGEWGDLCKEDRFANQDAIDNGYRVMSVYKQPQGTLWVITEHDRSVTTALLPSEY